jgi:FSR family fosmidomycin resistance protein-like MFS transporter
MREIKKELVPAATCRDSDVGRTALALYSAAHFWVDFSCALLIFGRLSGNPAFGFCALLYNFCAFALQMPLGLLADRLNRNGLAAASGCVLISAAGFLPQPEALAVAAGVGNALFHLGGGIDVLNGSTSHAAALGVFVSPGAAGLFLGTLLGRRAAPPFWLGPLGLLILAGLIAGLFHRPSGNASLSLSGSCGKLVPLFLVVVLRSYMGMNQSFSWNRAAWTPILILALALGKTAGGFAMDRLGPRRAADWSLGAAAVFDLGSALPLPGTAAVFLFNMTMPVTLWAAARRLPGAKGFAFGLLTFGLFLGFLPSYLGWPKPLSGPGVYAAASLASLILLRAGLRKEENSC